MSENRIGKSIVQNSFSVGTDRILVRIGRSYRLLMIEDIQWVEAQGNYLRIHLKDDSVLVRYALCKIEEKLDSRLFARINRSTIVRTDLIRELRSIDGSGFRVVVNEDMSWKWGRRYRNNLDKLMANNRME